MLYASKTLILFYLTFNSVYLSTHIGQVTAPPLQRLPI